MTAKRTLTGLMWLLLPAGFALAAVPGHVQAVNQQMDMVEGVMPAKDPVPIIQIPSQKPERKLGWHYEISPETSYISYHEPSLKVKEKGIMNGLAGEITYRAPKGDYLYSDMIDVYRLEGSFSYGKVKYDGSNVFNGISDYLFEIRGLFGKDYYLFNQSLLLTPYFGGGYRSLFDTLFADKPGGYNRRIQYAYIPVGTEAEYQLGDGWTVGLNLEYDWFLYGQVTSYLGELGLGDLTNHQKRGWGTRASLKITKTGRSFNFMMEPYFRYWHIYSSDIQESRSFVLAGQEFVLVGYEPDNNSMEIGGRFGIEF